MKRIIYVGPSLSKSRLLHATVFIGGIPQYVNEIIKEHPWFKNLLVPADRYVETMKIVKKPGTALNIYAKRCKEV